MNKEVSKCCGAKIAYDDYLDENICTKCTEPLDEQEPKLYTQSDLEEAEKRGYEKIINFCQSRKEGVASAILKCKDFDAVKILKAQLLTYNMVMVQAKKLKSNNK